MEMDGIYKRYATMFYTDDEGACGYIKSAEDYENFMFELKALGHYFVHKCYTKYKLGYEGSFSFTCGPKKGTKMRIPFFGPLYQVHFTKSMECHQGSQKWKRKPSAYQPEDGIIRRKRKKPSKKVNCPATFHLCKVTIYEDFTVKNYLRSGSRQQTQRVKEIKEALKGGVPVKSYDRYYFYLTHEHLHNHSTATSMRRLPLLPELLEEVHRMVSENITSIALIQYNLKQYCRIKFGHLNIDNGNTAFFPTNRTLSNHVQDAMKKYQITNRDPYSALVPTESLTTVSRIKTEDVTMDDTVDDPKRSSLKRSLENLRRYAKEIMDLTHVAKNEEVINDCEDALIECIINLREGTPLELLTTMKR